MPKIPKVHIDFLMGRTHVWTPDRKIVRDLYHRFRWGAPLDDDKKPGHKLEAPRAFRKACYRYAIKTINGHRQLCRDCRF